MVPTGLKVLNATASWPGLGLPSGNFLRWIARQTLIRTLLTTDLSEVENEIRVRQVLNLAKQVPVHAVGNLGNGAVTAWVFWDRVPHLAIVAWLAVFAAFSARQLQRWWRARNRSVPRQIDRGPLLRATAWSFFAGSFWGIAAIFAFPPDSLPHQLFLAFVIGGVAAGAVASMAMQPLACMAYMMPALIPVFVLFAREPTAITHAMAAMYALYFAGLIAVLANGYMSFVEMVRTKVENRALTTGLAEASSASRAKSEFLAHMSHELRTPLNAILGFSEIIKGELLGPIGTERYREYARDIYDSGRHLLLIINDVLDTSKIEVGRLALHEEAVDIAAVVHDAIVLVEERARSAAVSVETDVPGEMPILIADSLRVKQVLLNLLSNSIKFTREPGQVTVGSRVREDGSLAIWVDDTGIGMTKSEIAIALQPFRQVHNVLARKYEGTGLGLPLARALVEMHGGQLDIASTPNVGTTVTAIFPATRLRHLKAIEPIGIPAAG
jgi:signal transduction histidine kinase